jgi:hypothetical protein
MFKKKNNEQTITNCPVDFCPFLLLEKWRNRVKLLHLSRQPGGSWRKNDSYHNTRGKFQGVDEAIWE